MTSRAGGTIACRRLISRHRRGQRRATHSGAQVLDEAGVLGERAAEHVGHGLARQVVIGRTEAAAHHQQIDTA